jgi:predicted Rossmann-fold nucleotide-binding protein
MLTRLDNTSLYIFCYYLIGMKTETNYKQNFLGICGSHSSTNSGISELALELSKEIFHANYDIVTGSCPGYPQDFTLGYINERAKHQEKNPGLIIGISPFGNNKKHIEMGMIQDGLDKIIYTGLGDNLKIPDCYSCRNHIIINSSDIGLVFPGTQGTLYEAELYLKSGKPAVFITGFEEAFDKEIDSILKSSYSHLKCNEPKDIVKYIREKNER